MVILSLRAKRSNLIGRDNPRDCFACLCVPARRQVASLLAMTKTAIMQRSHTVTRFYKEEGEL